MPKMANESSEFAQKKGARPQAESGLSREARVRAAGGVPLETK